MSALIGFCGLQKMTHQLTKKKFFELQSKVKLDLDAIEAKSGTDARIDAIETYISKNLSATDQVQVVLRYLYLMSAMVYYRRQGTCQISQVKKLSEAAVACLIKLQIDSERSALRFLYGEIHLVVSQLQRLTGDHWKAFWNGKLAQRYGNDHGWQMDHSAAIRASRLGYLSLANQHFERCLAEVSPGHDKHKLIVLGLVRNLRLAGSFDSALDYCQLGLNDGAEREVVFDFVWESALVKLSMTGDYQSLWQLLENAPEVHRTAYQLELYLYLAIHSQKSALKKGSDLLQQTNHGSSADRQSRVLLRLCRNYSDIVTASTALERRLFKAGELVSKLNQLISFDKELLIVAGLYRWLHRSGQSDFSVALGRRYQGMCYRATDGTCSDMLNLDIEKQADVSLKPA